MEEEVIKIKKRHYWWRYLLCGVTGFVLAIGGLAGGIYATGATVPADQLLATFGLNPDEYLTEEYGNKTIVELISHFSSGEVKFECLQDIRNITPYLDTLLEGVNIEIERMMGFKFDLTELYAQKFEEIGDYLYTTATNGISLPTVLGVNEYSNKILRFIAFDNGEPRSLGQLMNGFETILEDATLGDLIDYTAGTIVEKFAGINVMNIEQEFMNFPIGELLDITADSDGILKLIAYNIDAEGNVIPSSPRSLGDLMNADSLFDDIMNHAKLGDLITCEEGTILWNLKDSTLNSISSDIQTMHIDDFIDFDASDPANKALVFLSQYPINEITNAFSDATLGDLIDTGSDGILYNLRNCHLDTLADEINEMPLNQLLDVEGVYAFEYLGQFKYNELSDAFNNAKLNDLIEIEPGSPLEAFADKSLEELGQEDSFNDVTIAEIMPNLTEEDGIIYYLKDYTITNLQDGVNNLSLSQVIEIDETAPAVLKALADTKVSELSSTISTLSFADLLGIDENSPLMLQAIKDYNLENFEEGVNNLVLSDVIIVDGSSPKILQTLAGTKINDLGGVIETLTLNQVIDIDESSPKALQAIAGYSINELNDAFNNLTLSDVIEIPEDSTILIALKDTNINDLGSAINSLTMEDMLGIDESSPQILQALKNETIATIEDKINSLTISDVFSEDEISSSKVLSSLAAKGISIYEIGSAIDDLTLAEIMDIDSSSPKILQALAGTTISGLSSKISNLSIKDLFSDEDLIDNKFLKHLPEDTKLDEIGTAMLELTFCDVFEDEIFEDRSNGILKSTSWKYLLTDESGTINQSYRIGYDIQLMLDNMQRNVSNANLRDLVNDGFITLEDPSVLEKSVGYPGGPKLGDLTLEQLINTISAFLH